MGTILMEGKGFREKSCLFLSLKSFFALPILMLICISSLHPVTGKTLWDNDESNHNISDVKQILPMVSIGGHQFLVEQQYFEQLKEQKRDYSGLKDVMYDEETAFHHNLHLRYLMSSTAEQPDNSGRSSAFNIWLTILIAALAAAILS